MQSRVQSNASDELAFSGQSGHHGVQFYSDRAFLCGVVADFLAEGLRASEPGLVIARTAHRDAIQQQLAARDLDVAQLVDEGTLAMLDAEATLSLFLVDGEPDPERFSAVIGSVIERVCSGHTNCVVRAYGEMVDVLWRGNNPEGAIALEVLWNELAMTHSFSLLCGYSTVNLYERTGVRTICNQHTHVLPQF